MINEKEAVEKLREDEHYYGNFGKKFLSNSDISTLLKNPLDLNKPREQVPAFLVGGYFHTAILEPDKLKKYKIVEASTRNTKKYKEISAGEMCLLQHEVDQLEVMIDKVLNNDVCKGLIRPIDGEYELPGITEIDGIAWKGKADIINRDDGLIVDLKTTAKLDDFRWSASKYNYDSQAYIYQKIFGYDMVFVDEGPSGQRTGSWSNLWIFDLESKEEEKITDEEAPTDYVHWQDFKSDKEKFSHH